MENFYNIDEKIEEMRELLQELIEEKSNLLDTEVIAVSQKLDEILNEYNKLLKKQNKI